MPGKRCGVARALHYILHTGALTGESAVAFLFCEEADERPLPRFLKQEIVERGHGDDGGDIDQPHGVGGEVDVQRQRLVQQHDQALHGEVEQVDGDGDLPQEDQRPEGFPGFHRPVPDCRRDHGIPLDGDRLSGREAPL